MNLPFTLDDGAGANAALGIIVLQSDETLEAEFRTVFDLTDVALYHTRIASAPEVTPETLKQMELDLPRSAALLKMGRPLDVVGYGCTSGATIIGPENIDAAIRTEHPGVRTTNPITAVTEACHALGVRRIGFLTPYIADVSAAMRALLESSGLAIAAFGSFEQSEEAVVAKISEQSVLDSICAIGRHPDVEAVFASCTNLRSFNIIEKAEATIGKPVITSNQALAWHMLKLAGLAETANGPGRLFKSGG